VASSPAAATTRSLASDQTHDVAYHGESGEDTLTGGHRRDQLFGGDQNDQISGGGNHDIIDGGKGADAIDAGSGNDQLHVRDNWAEYDLLIGGNGFDTVVNTDANRDVRFHQFLSTDTDWDLEKLDANGRKVLGNSQDNVLDFRDVQLVGVAGVYAGSGNDTILASDQTHDVAYHGESGEDTLTGGHRRDQLFGGGQNDQISGGGNHDIIDGGKGADAIDAGSGNDQLHVRDNWAEYDLLIGGNGFDTVVNTDANRDVRFHQFLSTDNDWDLEKLDANGRKVLGNSQDNVLDFRDVQLVGVSWHLHRQRQRHDLASDQTHDVAYHGESGEDTLMGGHRRDQLFGGDQNDQISGGGNHDIIDGGKGADEIDAGSGNDQLHVRDNWAEYDLLIGGNGFDTVVNTDGDRDIRFHQFLSTDTDWDLEKLDANGRKVLGNSQDNVLDFREVQLVGVAGVYAGSGNDTILASDQTHDVAYHGESGEDTLTGGHRRDQLFGGDQNDQISGGGNHDIIDGGKGADEIDAGSGNDQLHVRDNWAEYDLLIGGNGFDTVVNTDGDRDIRFHQFLSTDTDWDLEKLDANGRKVLGNSQDNVLDFRDVQLVGVSGIFAGSGNDTIWASDQTHDVAYHGESGNDVLTGGNRRDVLVGGAGIDSLSGGGSSDRFVIQGNGHVDEIADFQPGQGDKLDLSRLGFLDWDDFRSAISGTTTDLDDDGHQDDLALDLDGNTFVRVLDTLFDDLEEDWFLF
jgi:Ca2+-binding RTX toxin-like protein